MSAESEEQCLRKSLERTGWALGILVVVLVAAIVIAVTR